MIQRLSSVKLAFYNLIILILLMGIGVFLSQTFKNEFTLMNNTGIFDWLAFTCKLTPGLVIWFLLLCAGAASLFVNALCCTLARQLVLAKKSGVLKNWLFFILHCLFIIVLACHGLILVVGEKQSHVILGPEQTQDFGQYTIQISDIVFTNDINILKASKKKRRLMMTRKNIQIDKNYVNVTLLKDSSPLVSKKVMMLSPLRYKSLQVTLIEFVDMEGDNGLGVNLTLTKNVLNGFFFSVYGVMILALAGFTAVTWKKSGFEKEKKI
ncbi:MAG: hypothetical protein K8S13_01975 [Desulfobacula sp.]|uniref:hypothetical protein n=1 Tax=Desulfobacula sp. TaxID=2593537 RepID=UPI0025BEB9A1|nr:hypothetical protein [Desulfobacula sp.]MCD4718614.1 hypothetical protein [Desulfobacula sp.]